MYNLNRCGCLRDDIQAESIGPVIDDKKLCAVKNYMWWIAMLCQKIFFPPYTSSRNGRLTKNFWKTTRRGLKWWIYDLWLFRKAARPQVLKLWMKIFLPECLKMNWAIETSEDTLTSEKIPRHKTYFKWPFYLLICCKHDKFCQQDTIYRMLMN